MTAKPKLAGRWLDLIVLGNIGSGRGALVDKLSKGERVLETLQKFYDTNRNNLYYFPKRCEFAPWSDSFLDY